MARVFSVQSQRVCGRSGRFSRAIARSGAVWIIAACAGAGLAQPSVSPVTPLSGNQPDAQPTVAQPVVVTPAQADVVWRAERWADAANAYRVLCRDEPDNAEYHFRLAYALHADGQYRRAVPAHEEAAEFAEYRATALYNLGCAHAVLGNADRAFEALHDAIDAGFEDMELMETDQDLLPLHDDARWQGLLSAVPPPVVLPYDPPPTRPTPPSTRGPLDEVDFMLGEWEVLDDRGRRLGSMSAHPMDHERGVVFNWRGDRGESSMAMLFFDEFEESWRSVTVDSDGNVTELSGHAHRAEFEYEGEVHTERGGQFLQRGTIEQRRDGNLEHVIEESEDEGRTWRVVREQTLRHLGIVPPGNPGRPEPGRPTRPWSGGKPPK